MINAIKPKIKIDLDTMKTCCKTMKDNSGIVKSQITDQTRIVNGLKEYWQGEDYTTYKNNWDSFTTRYDKRITTQVEQYYKYLAGFCETINYSYDRIKGLAVKLPH